MDSLICLLSEIRSGSVGARQNSPATVEFSLPDTFRKTTTSRDVPPKRHKNNDAQQQTIRSGWLVLFFPDSLDGTAPRCGSLRGKVERSPRAGPHTGANISSVRGARESCEYVHACRRVKRHSAARTDPEPSDDLCLGSFCHGNGAISSRQPVGKNTEKRRTFKAL